MRTPADILRSLKSQIAQRVSLMISRVLINLVDASGAVQLMQVDGLADEVLDEVEHLQDYGFVSNPPKGSEGVMVGVGGVRSNGVVIAVGNRRYRLKGLAAGEAALHDDQGQVVHLKRDGILIQSAQKIDIEAPQVTVIGDATVTGNAVVEGDATVNGTAVCKGDVKLGGDNPTKFVMLADMTPSTKVKAL